MTFDGAALIATGKTAATYSAEMAFDKIERIASYRRVSTAPGFCRCGNDGDWALMKSAP